MKEAENISGVLDLSKKCLKKIPKSDVAQDIRTFVLDDNELQKLDNIDSYSNLIKLSVAQNQLLRMYGVGRLHFLTELSLPYNGILAIEGLKDLINLQHLNLEGNNIKTIEHLCTNKKLETLNLGENSISSIADISFLLQLKVLNLHGNRLTHLRLCDKYLPKSLETLTLAKNYINDLNEICTLVNLSSLTSFNISENPCLKMTGTAEGFDHRPFVLNWIMSLQIIDGFVVDPIESLKAEWLYSQGRGRQFRVGEQIALSRYLSSVCPVIGKALENENDRKLRLILSKAQQHQRQLLEESSENLCSSRNSSPSLRRKVSSRIQSPRYPKPNSSHEPADLMSNSYHGSTSASSFASNSSDILTTNDIETNFGEENTRNKSKFSQSLDCSFISSNNMKNNNSQELTSRNITNDATQSSGLRGPLATASKMVPVPESLISPDCCPIERVSVFSLNSKTSNLSLKYDKRGSPKSLHLKRYTEKLTNDTPKKIKNISSNSKVQRSKDGQFKTPRFSNCIAITTLDGFNQLSSEDESDNVNVDKLRTIRSKAAQKALHKTDVICHELVSNDETWRVMETSAKIIQKIWRGYRTRKNLVFAEKLLKKRTMEYIAKLAKDMEITKIQLENEKKIQQLQMQAINALWRKVCTLPSSSEEFQVNAQVQTKILNCPKKVTLDNSSTAIVNDLANTCSLLTNQVQQLQESIHGMLNCMTLLCNIPLENIKKKLITDEFKNTAETQTDIVAVHTPQIESGATFLFKPRPSSLPLDVSEKALKSGHEHLYDSEVITQHDKITIEADDLTNKNVASEE